MAGSSEYEQLRDLLVAQEVSGIQDLKQALEALQQQLRDPEEIAKRIQPIIAETVRRGDPALSLAILKAITPLLDRAVGENVDTDSSGMTRALAPTSTGAIALHYAHSPHSAAQDLAPLVSAAIKEQIRGEREAVIDALYPVIGSTISKYLSETLTALVERINERIESHLSIGALVRKIRSRLTGVSEAELLLRESLPLRVEAVFLIHIASGMVIAQSQNPGSVALDADLLSGMLTAIRSFFNDSMNPGGGNQELDQIEYGEHKIVLEASGSCYLAAVVRGIPGDAFRQQLREAMASIVQLPGNGVADFSGNQAAVPESVVRTVQQLVEIPHPLPSQRRRQRPYAVATLALVLLLGVGIPLGIHFYRNGVDRDAESRTVAALQAAGPAVFDRIRVQADRGILRLSGATPNELQQTRAELVARTSSPGMTVENQITPDASPLFPVFVEKTVESLVSGLNTVSGISLDAKFHDGDLIITGVAADSSLAQNIRRTFESLPGLRSLDTRFRTADMEIGNRLHFALNSVQILPQERAELDLVKNTLDRAPWSILLITGHCDLAGGETVNKRIASGRAAAVQIALQQLGIPRNRILIEGNPGPPPGGPQAGTDSLSRCVRFTLVPANTTAPK